MSYYIEPYQEAPADATPVVDHENRQSNRWGVWVTGPTSPNGSWISFSKCPDSQQEAESARDILSKRFLNYHYEVREYQEPEQTMSPAPKQEDMTLFLSFTEDRLAHLLFEADEMVREAIAVADDRGGGSFLRTREGAYAVEREEMYRRAWDRNEGGRREWAVQMATRMFAAACGHE